MKKINRLCALTALFFLFFLSARAQNNYPRNEISLGYGFGSVQQLATAFSDAFVAGISGQQVEEISGTGTFSLSFNRFVSQKFSVGLTGVFERITTTYSNPVDKYDWSVFAIMANGKFYYNPLATAKLYSGLAVGYASFASNSEYNDETNGAFAFQVNLLGVRIGQNFGGFGELGFGYEGILKIGLSYRF